MNKIMKSGVAAVLLSLLILAVPAYADIPQIGERGAVPEKRLNNGTGPSVPATPALTDAQKQELAALYKSMFEQKKQLVAKYLQFGVITDEKAKQWTMRIDQHYAKLEQNGFVPQWSHGRKFRENRKE